MIYAIAAALVLVLDQAVKFWTTKNILLDATADACVDLIPKVVHMTNVHNYGAAFSILENARWLLIAVSVLFVIGIIVLINLEIIHTPFGKWTSVLVVAGAIGNCFDRILYGYVVDMFELELFSFPVFNVADIFITVCGILFCIHVIVYREPAEVVAANESERAHRRREAREEKVRNDPYAAIPHRGAHRDLEDELRLSDPDDPFAEWDFGGVVDEPEPERLSRRARASEEEPAPRRVRTTQEEPAPRRVRTTQEEPAPRRVRTTQEEPAPRRASQGLPTSEKTSEGGKARRVAPAAGWDEDIGLEEPAPRQRSQTGRREAKPAPVKEPPRRPARTESMREQTRRPAPVVDEPADMDLDAAGEEEYSLEDILSEFGDFGDF